MILTVDVGNTRIKAAVFEEDILLQHLFFMKEELKENIENILKKFKNTSHGCCVGRKCRKQSFEFEKGS
jgi:type III pantothenate kinase